jgi:hypothetical protein
MLLEENLQLLAETFLPVMFLLRLDVMNRILHARHADAERAKPFLPRETMLTGVGVKYGKDSNEYEKAGGVRTSERKSPSAPRQRKRRKRPPRTVARPSPR